MKKVDISNKVNSFFNVTKTKIKNAGKLMGRKVVSLYNAIKGLPGKVNKMFHTTMGKVNSTVRGKKPVAQELPKSRVQKLWDSAASTSGAVKNATADAVTSATNATTSAVKSTLSRFKKEKTS